MNKENYSWYTDFNTSENLMIHTFSERVQAVSNIKTGLVKVVKDGVVIREVENSSISDYEKLLLGIAEDSEKLNSFNPES